MDNSKKIIKSNRIISVDVLRGLTICFMILVDDPAGKSFEFLKHPIWTGLTLADFIFPTFITLMGVSMFFSLGKFNFKPNAKSIFRIIRRFILLCLFGWVVSRICVGITAGFAGKDVIATMLDFSAFRVMGIFQRIALCYLFGAIIVLLVHNKKVLIGIIVVILVGYCVLLGFGNGYEFSESSVLSVFDKSVFGVEHMYKMTDYDGNEIALDPEGLLSTIPCIAQTLLGFLIGGIIKDKKYKENTKIIYMFVLGFSLLIAGFVLGCFIPCFKKAWTTPFVLTTVGVDSCMLALFTWIIDIKGHKKWCKFFQVYGSNALIAFAGMDIIWVLLARLKVVAAVYNFFLSFTGNIVGLASFITTLLFVLALWLLLYFLDKKKIYIRL